MASLGDTRPTASGAGVMSPPPVALPKGGGAFRSVGEKFAANPVTGAGSLSIPIPTTPGRSRFGPHLALTYDSAAGNGPFGFGWSLNLAAITRKTDKGLPRYQDGEDSDVFLLSGLEDLVPVLLHDGTRREDRTRDPAHVLHFYRPRIEGLFARIERWTRLADGDIHWRVVGRDNVTTIYGRDPEARIADPAAPNRVFSWLVCETYDDKGNACVFRYVAEDGRAVDLGQAHERNRDRRAGRYLKRVLYGNRVSRLVAPDLQQAEWLFEVVFDYDEGHVLDAPLEPGVPEDAQHRHVGARPDAVGDWAVRPDPFSSHRAGFEVRTYRRCRRAMMFHHIPDLPGGEAGYDGLVRSIDFDYDDFDPASGGVDAELAHLGSTRFASVIRRATECGYAAADRPALTHDGLLYPQFRKRTLPALEFGYTRARLDDAVREVDPDTAAHLPQGLAAWGGAVVDLDGEGLSGVLSDDGGAWRYAQNRGGAHFGAPQPLTTAPTAARARFVDLAGDGDLDVAEFAGPTPGFWERAAQSRWETFRPFEAWPNIAWDDPNLRLVDLDGDGLADVLITENEVFRAHLSEGEGGFSEAMRTPQPIDEERGPRLAFAEPEACLHLADMCGDGLADVVRIRNGEICYWPNLGYGRFGPKVTMDEAPWLDHPDQFDARRVWLADIDGSGTNDLIYIGRDGVRLYFNQAGNRWTGPRPILAFPHLDDLASVMAADLLGDGTACLVWSSALPADRGRPLRYIRLMDQKPHLLRFVANNLGIEVDIAYAPSTAFYLEDMRRGRPWITRLPFPVHVVTRLETTDRVSGNRFVTRYAYHHGFFDGLEREFRGFGMVEQWDGEVFAPLDPGRALPANGEAASHVPLTYVKSWFHTGVSLARARVSDYFAGLLDPRDLGEYHREPGLDDAAVRARLLADTVLPADLAPEEEAEACRALKGALLRQETYALDGGPRETRPYAITEQTQAVRRLQARGSNRHGVFLASPRESLRTVYERGEGDPRASHELVLETDDFGQARRTLSVAYGRRTPDPQLSAEDQALQATALAVYAEHDVTAPLDAGATYRSPLPAESRRYELTGLGRRADTDRLSLEAADALVETAPRLPFEATPSGGAVELRVFERTRTLYRRDDLAGPLPPGVAESLALPYDTYRLALTPGLVDAAFGGRVTPAMLRDEGRYVTFGAEPDWWAPEGLTFYSPDPGDLPAAELAHARAHFFLPHRTRNAFHTPAESTESVVLHDPYDLLPLEAVDALGNRYTAGERDPDPTRPLVRTAIDYRMVQPALVMDPNRNRSAVAYDTLGMAVAHAVLGKPEEAVGDQIPPDLPLDLTPRELDDFLADPRGPAARRLLETASERTVYDLFAYARAPQDRRPALAARLAREVHASVPAPAGGAPFRTEFLYADGFGREIQRKVPAEPGPVPVRDAAGGIVLDAAGDPVMTSADQPRWVGSGWIVLNNKGKPVCEFEPFFSDTPAFEDDVRLGVTPVLFYDPLSRLVGRLHPDHTWEKVALDPWCETRFTVSGTVLDDPAADPVVGGHVRRLDPSAYQPSWRELRLSGGLGPAAQEAAAKTDWHAGARTETHGDPLGRGYLSVAYNRFERGGAAVEEIHTVRSVLDIDGEAREVRDALGRIAVRRWRSPLGLVLRTASQEAGERWTFFDVGGAVVRAWDSRGHAFETRYDRLRRARETWLQAGSGPAQLTARIDYGEAEPGPEARNLRGQVVRQFDQAGQTACESFDFLGRPVETRRSLVRNVGETLDWLQPPDLEPQSYATRATYDALGRMTELITPDLSVQTFRYNEAALLDSISVRVRGGPERLVIADIDYDADGRRTEVVHGDGVVTRYAYDRRTGRLSRLTTERPSDHAALQDLSYTYDAAGGITRIADAAQPTVYFRNQALAAQADYAYDAAGRLIEARGRERIGPAPDWRDTGRRAGPHPGDGQQMRAYVERFTHDAAGNVLEVVHAAGGDGWTRTYAYDEPSAIEPAQRSNRLSRATLGAEAPDTFAYDAHGSLISAPHLSQLRWDFGDRLQATTRQASSGDPAEETSYAYDLGGERLRKLTQVPGQGRRRERLYLGGWETYREYDAAGDRVLERETLHVRDAGRVVAEIETVVHGQGVGDELVRRPFADHLGSSRVELDGAGQILSYEEYYPYGATSYQAGPNAVEVERKRYRWCGLERDEESGFSLHGARYYAPWLGRWVSADPAGVAGGLNLYQYAASNPVGLVDPSGLQPDEPDGVPHDAGIWVPPAAGADNPGTWVSQSELDDAHDTLRIIAAPVTLPVGAAVGAGETAIDIVTLPGKITYYATSHLLHRIFRVDGESPWSEQDATARAGLQGAIDFANHPGEGLKSYVKQRGDAIVDSARNYDFFGVGRNSARVGVELFVVAESIASIKPPTLGSGPMSVGDVAVATTTVTATATANPAKIVATGMMMAAKTPAKSAGEGSGGSGSIKRTKPKKLNAREQAARQAALSKLFERHLSTLAGDSFHSAMGAARRGVDHKLFQGALQIEDKSHYTSALSVEQVQSASAQSFRYSQEYQLSTGLVPIRMVRHYMLNPQNFPNGLRLDLH